MYQRLQSGILARGARKCPPGIRLARKGPRQFRIDRLPPRVRPSLPTHFRCGSPHPIGIASRPVGLRCRICPELCQLPAQFRFTGKGLRKNRLRMRTPEPHNLGQPRQILHPVHERPAFLRRPSAKRIAAATAL